MSKLAPIVLQALQASVRNTWMLSFFFAGAGQRRRLFRVLDILMVKWTTGDLPEDCRFLFNTQLMFLKKEKDPTTKIFLTLMSGFDL